MSIERTKRPVNKGSSGGKQKFWRTNAIKGYGKALRNAMSGANHPAGPTDKIIFMLKSAGIETPKLDKQLSERYNIKQAETPQLYVNPPVDSNIVDVEPIAQGA
jgi:hypothetical protein